MSEIKSQFGNSLPDFDPYVISNLLDRCPNFVSCPESLVKDT